VSRKAWQRGDIVAADVRPTPGRKQQAQAQAPAIVVTQAALNRLGMIGVCPITPDGPSARQAGMVVSLTGAGLQTAGLFLVHQFRMIDPTQQRLKRIEQAPDYISEEVRARVAAMLD
jgi:mRNA interferase ChpB